MKRKHFLLSLLLLGALRLMAVPAYTGWIQFRQPQSETLITILLRGDERVHWAESEEGYSLLYGPEGALYYAQPDGKGGMMPSEFLALPKEQRTPEMDAFLKGTPKALRYSQQQVDLMLDMWKRVEQHASKQKTMSDVIGEKRFLVILFAFQDQAFSHSKAEFEHLFNQVGYSANQATGSVHDYYYDVSHHQFSLSVDIVGPFIGTRETAFYGDNGSEGYQAFATEAVDSAALFVDFSNYDNDNDGYIDGLHIIFAGTGEEAGGGADKIWSHKWNIFSEPVYNNTRINVYSCSPELAGGSSTGSTVGTSLTAIGVICHELGHVFGAPDYYDTDYAGSGGEYPGLGKWDIMSSGSWNNGGITPAHHNPYTKIYIYRWATCDTLTSPQQLTLNPVATSNTDFHRINTSTPGDFFLMENRQKIKWDAHIPGHGLLVYHIHPNAHGASVANYTHPQQIYILAGNADTFPNNYPSSYGDLNSSIAAYPGYYNDQTQLTDDTKPALRPWNRQRNNTPLTYISENNAHQTVSFCFRDVLPRSFDLAAYGVSDSSIRLVWTNYGSLPALILYSPDGTFGTPSRNYRVGDTVEGGGIVAAISGSNSAIARNLQPDQLYHFRLYNKLNDSTYTPTYLSAQALTLACASSWWQHESFDNPDHAACWISEQGEHAIASGALSFQGTLFAPPVDFPDTNLPYILSIQAQGSTQTPLQVCYRGRTDGEWDTLLSIGDSPHSRGDRYCAVLSSTSNYSMLRFDFPVQGTSASATIEDIEFVNGYLVHAYCSVGGHVSNEGYHVTQRGDSLYFQITPDAGYRFANLYINGERKTGQVHGGVYRMRVSNHTELRFTFTSTAVIDQHKATPLRVYPNPTSDYLTVEGNSEAGIGSIELYDLYGRRVLRQNLSPSPMPCTLDLRSLPKGVYLLRCGSQTQKIIKK